MGRVHLIQLRIVLRQDGETELRVRREEYPEEATA